MKQIRLIVVNVLFVFSACLVYHSSALAQPFSEQAWHETLPVYHKILSHPFIHALKNGTLSASTYHDYVEQDNYYLKYYARTLKALADKIANEKDKEKILRFAKETLREHHDHRTIQFEAITPANLAYVDFLLKNAAYQSREEIIAAVLPCFWIYYQLAHDLHGQAVGPYAKWFETYDKPAFHEDVKYMIQLTNRLADAADEPTRHAMLMAFKVAVIYELQFIDNAYHNTRFF